MLLTLILQEIGRNCSQAEGTRGGSGSPYGGAQSRAGTPTSQLASSHGSSARRGRVRHGNDRCLATEPQQLRAAPSTQQGRQPSHPCRASIGLISIPIPVPVPSRGQRRPGRSGSGPCSHSRQIRAARTARRGRRCRRHPASSRPDTAAGSEFVELWWRQAGSVGTELEAQPPVTALFLPYPSVVKKNENLALFASSSPSSCYLFARVLSHVYNAVTRPAMPSSCHISCPPFYVS